MKIVKNSAENCDFYSHEKSLYIAWAYFRNVHFGRQQGGVLYQSVFLLHVALRTYL